MTSVHHSVPDEGKAEIDDSNPNDLRAIFAHLKLSEDEFRELEKHMLEPYNLGRIPSDEQVTNSPLGLYYFGFYTQDFDIREFAIKYDKEHLSCLVASAHDMDFMATTLSLVLDSPHDVYLRRVVVSEWHKKVMPKSIQERAGETAYLLVILSTDDYERGYHLSNREVKELIHILKKKLCWWEAVC